MKGLEDVREAVIQIQRDLHAVRQKREHRDSKILEQVVTDLQRVRSGLEMAAYEDDE